MFLMKIHKAGEGKILAICDEALLGKVFEEEGKILNISSDFFGGVKTELMKIKEELKDCVSANIIGNKIIELLDDTNLNIQETKGIKHTQIFKL